MSDDDSTFYEQALRELEDGRAHQPIAAKAFAQAEGDAIKSRALYIQFRVAQLQQEVIDAASAAAKEKRRKYVTRPLTLIGLFVIAIVSSVVAKALFRQPAVSAPTVHASMPAVTTVAVAQPPVQTDEQRHFAMIAAAHPDWKAIVASAPFRAYVADHQLQSIVDQGTADQIIAMLDAYKLSTRSPTLRSDRSPQEVISFTPDAK